MLLQSRVVELVDGVIRLVAGVVNCLGDVLDVLVDLLFVCGRRVRVGADEVDQWLDALNQKGCLIFEVVLNRVRSRLPCAFETGYIP